MRSKQPRVLYFTKGPKPTEKEMAKAQSLSSNIGYRFALGTKGINAESGVDCVAGVNVPGIYREGEQRLPYVNTAQQAMNAMLRNNDDVAEFDPDKETDPDVAAALAPVGGDGTGNQSQNGGGGNDTTGGGWGSGQQQV